MTYRCIVMDPPWEELGGGGRGAQNHYSTMELSAIAKTVMRAPEFKPAASAHLWVWVTDNFLLDGLSLIDQLQFRYVRTFCWVKLQRFRVRESDVGLTTLDVAADAMQIGLGQYARGSHELCLFATRGGAMLPARAPPSVLFAERNQHSRKPDACYDEWFEQVSPGPRLEMFARRARPGWGVWGNEAPDPGPPAAGNLCSPGSSARGPA